MIIIDQNSSMISATLGLPTASSILKCKSWGGALLLTAKLYFGSEQPRQQPWSNLRGGRRIPSHETSYPHPSVHSGREGMKRSKMKGQGNHWPNHTCHWPGVGRVRHFCVSQSQSLITCDNHVGCTGVFCSITEKRLWFKMLRNRIGL